MPSTKRCSGRRLKRTGLAWNIKTPEMLPERPNLVRLGA